ncbi:MAG: hypothetical protein ACR2FO_00765 [Actinomycetota bacterium]
MEEARRKGARPFDPDRDLKAYQKGLFSSDEELDQFIAEIYAARRNNLA